MRKRFPLAFAAYGALVVLLTVSLVNVLRINTPSCLIGAFLADRPLKSDILKFESEFGRQPYLVMVFVDWGR
jgi:hypothetical protein